MGSGQAHRRRSPAPGETPTWTTGVPNREPDPLGTVGATGEERSTDRGRPGNSTTARSGRGPSDALEGSRAPDRVGRTKVKGTKRPRRGNRSEGSCDTGAQVEVLPPGSRSGTTCPDHLSPTRYLRTPGSVTDSASGTLGSWDPPDSTTARGHPKEQMSLVLTLRSLVST